MDIELTFPPEFSGLSRTIKVMPHSGDGAVDIEMTVNENVDNEWRALIHMQKWVAIHVDGLKEQLQEALKTENYMRAHELSMELKKYGVT